MEVHIHKRAGLRNDLLVAIPRAELKESLLHITHRERLMALPGLVRHRALTADERAENAKCKISLEDHLELLGLLNRSRRATRRVIAVGNRNLGNNHGFVAWQCDAKPRLFHVSADPLNYPAYTCLVAYQCGHMAIEKLCFEDGGERLYLAGDHTELTGKVRWATFGQQVLRQGEIVNITAILDQFYDIRHVLAYDAHTEHGKRIETEVFNEYPGRFKENAYRLLCETGVPRNRYMHNCIGLSPEMVFILQREGTPEEVAGWLREAGAHDGVILDNGGSVACWAWWPCPAGGFLFTAPDYRPKASSIIALVLNGPAHTNLPGGSVSYALV